jgi:uncharacterized protein with NAD-binding domain and iron-sulfur cluster
MPDDRTTPRLRRKTIAILGGGLGGLSAAFELTSHHRWYEQYRLDIYQKGWRLGGKGASGRGPNGRIEEHGLHCFWGFYDNAFRMLRTCYSEIGRTAGPLRTVDDAFQRLNSVYFIDQVHGQWCRYQMTFPESNERPGEGPPLTEMSVAELGMRFIGQVRAVLSDVPELADHFVASARGALDEGRELLGHGFDLLGSVWGKLSTALEPGKGIGVSTHLDAATRAGATALLDGLTGASGPARPAATDPAASLEAGYRRYVLFQAVAFAFFVLKGLARDGIPATLEGFSRFDDEDLRQWLARHGAGPDLLGSPILRGLYDASFCYPGGDMSRPGDLAAGVSLRAVLLMGFMYKGSFMWKMQASMGDVVFAPLYEALVRRGQEADRLYGGQGSLSFRFFHKVTKLSLDAAKKGVETIAIDVQAKPATGLYAPLVEIQGLPCWPSTPRYDQLVAGATLQKFDLESDWSTLEPAARPVLRRGADFDTVVLAIPVGALRTICSDLLATSPAWQSMVDNVKTIRTKSFQVWLAANDAQAAWQRNHLIMTDVYENDFNSVADMRQTLDFEDWPAGARPGGVTYFSTAMKEDPDAPGVPDDGYQGRQDAVVYDQSREWLAKWQEGIFGWMTGPFAGAAFVDQYSRANVNMDQRYTLSVAGSTKYRLSHDQSGFDNLLLAGDWIRSPLDLGCAENAVMSGLRAGAAVASAVFVETPAEPQTPAAAQAPFVEYPGMPVYPPTYRQTGITLCEFVLKADPRRLQQALDTYLNASAGGHRFRALGRWVLFQTGHIAGNVSAPPGDVYGTGQETSATFLVPCARWRGWDRPGALPVEVGFFAPFIFVDHPLSVVAGREVLGMAKHLASFDAVMPDNLDQTTMSTMAVRVLGRDSPVESLPLLRVRRGVAVGTPARSRGFWNEARRGIDAVVASIAPTGRSDIVHELLERLLGAREVFFFSLRQLRDTRDPHRAAFREITRGRMRLGHVALESLSAAHTIEIERLASHPIARCLGLDDGPLTPVAAVKVRIDEAMLDLEP